jgi:hypothetical protein
MSAKSYQITWDHSPQDSILQVEYKSVSSSEKHAIQNGGMTQKVKTENQLRVTGKYLSALPSIFKKENVKL